LKRRGFIATAGAAATAPGLAGAATSSESHRWRMVTSWPKRFPGPGTGAERLAERIGTMSGGRLTVTVHGAGELVPPLEVFDAVSAGRAEVGHSASFFWRGKAPASVFFTTVPFGLTATEHAAWIYHGGGMEINRKILGKYGITYLGATPMEGEQIWSKKPLYGLNDLKGLKMRAAGLAADSFSEVGNSIN